MARKAVGLYASALVAAMVLAGCMGSGAERASESLSTSSPAPAATDPAAARQRAQAVLSAWEKAVATAGDHAPVTPVGELTGQIGDWEEAVGDNNSARSWPGWWRP